MTGWSAWSSFSSSFIFVFGLFLVFVVLVFFQLCFRACMLLLLFVCLVLFLLAVLTSRISPRAASALVPLGLPGPPLLCPVSWFVCHLVVQFLGCFPQFLLLLQIHYLCCHLHYSLVQKQLPQFLWLSGREVERSGFTGVRLDGILVRLSTALLSFHLCA